MAKVFQNAAEKRAALEARVVKLTEKDVASRVEATKAKLQGEIDKLATYKEYEGQVALWDVEGNGKVKVRVIVNGYARKAFKRELFSVTPLEGEGAVNVSEDRLTFEGVTPPLVDAQTATAAN